MTSISTDQIAAVTYTPTQAVAANRQTTVQAASQAPAPMTSPQTSDSYSSQAYQMTLGDASAAQQNMQMVQAQNHLIERMNAGVAGDEV